MKQKIYIETSVISYLTARPSRNLVIAAHQASTSDFWQLIDQYEFFISDIVMQEASRGDAVQARLRSQVIEEFPVGNSQIITYPNQLIYVIHLQKNMFHIK